MANEVMRRKAVENNVEYMNEWVDELHAEINDAKMAVKALVRVAKAANDKLNKVTSIACTRLELLKGLKIGLAETTDTLMDEGHQREDLERVCTIHLDIKRVKQMGRRCGSGKWTVHIVILIFEILVNGTPP